MTKSNSELRRIVDIAKNRYEQQARSYGYDTVGYYLAQEIGIELDCFIPSPLGCEPTIKSMMKHAKAIYAAIDI